MNFPTQILAALLLTTLLLSSCGQDSGGTGLQSGTAALLTVSNSPSFSFGHVVVGESTSKVFTVQNVGLNTATQMQGAILSSAFSFLGGTYPGADGTCAEELAPGAQCTVAVAFNPYLAERFEISLGIFYFDGVLYQTSSSPFLEGQGFAPAP